MGLFFTLFYILTAYLAPATIYGTLADNHIQVAVVLIALGFSLFTASGSGVGTMPQTWALVGLTVVVALSIMVNGWLGGAPIALLEFIPNAVTFLLVLLNCRKKIHLQILVAVLFLFACFVIYQGGMGQLAENPLNPYVLRMQNDEGAIFYRLRGLGFLNDPNDLSQFFVGLIPCMFFLWRRGKIFMNLFTVYLPIAVLIFGMFLTHSRGGMVALLAATIIMGRRKLGVVPSVLLGGLVFAGLTAAGFSGGRDVSAESGSDRIEAWSEGLTLIKTHPVLGVGFERFTEFFYITAHNTIVVCAAETGMIGLFFWILFVFPTIRNVYAAARSTEPVKVPKQNSGVQNLPQYVQYAPAFAGADMPMLTPHQTGATYLQAVQNGPQGLQSSTHAEPDALAWMRQEEPGRELWSREEVHRLNGIMLVSLTGFFTAGWFLSRPYTMTLFVATGIAAAVYRISQEQEFTASPLPFARTLRLSGYFAVGLILLIYAMLRAQHLLGI